MRLLSEAEVVVDRGTFGLVSNGGCCYLLFATTLASISSTNTS